MRASTAVSALIAVAWIIGFAWPAGGAEQPAPKGPTTAPFVIGEARLQSLPAQTYLYETVETTLAQIAQAAETTMTAMGKAMADAKVQATGAPIFTYYNLTGDPNAQIKVEIGFPVADGVKAIGQYKVRQIEASRCVTLIYSGPMTNIGQAYARLMPAIFGAGLRPAAEMREQYLYWEKVDSPNNIVYIQVPVQ